MCKCIAEENARLKEKNAQIILYNNNGNIVPVVATEKINTSLSDRIPLIPAKFCPLCGDEIK